MDDPATDVSILVPFSGKPGRGTVDQEPESCPFLSFGKEEQEDKGVCILHLSHLRVHDADPDPEGYGVSKAGLFELCAGDVCFVPETGDQEAGEGLLRRMRPETREHLVKRALMNGRAQGQRRRGCRSERASHEE